GEQRAGAEADRRVRRVIDELRAGSGGHSADARQRRRVPVVPRVRPIAAIAGLRDDFTPYIRSQRKPPLYQILTSHARLLVGPKFARNDGYLNAGITSRASNSSPRMMCVCGIAGKDVRQIRWIRPYACENLMRFGVA